MIFFKIITHGLPFDKMADKFVFDKDRFNDDSDKLEECIEELGQSLMTFPCPIPESELKKMVYKNVHHLKRLFNVSLHAIDRNLSEIFRDNLQSLRKIMRGALPIMSFLDFLLKGVADLLFKCMEYDEENGLGHCTRDNRSLVPLKRVQSLAELLKIFLKESGYL